jgi:hypothetical protein
VSDRRPIDLDGSDAFFEYVIDLRRIASFDPNNVSRDGNANSDFSTMATSSDSNGESTLGINDDSEQPDYGAALEALDRDAILWLEYGAPILTLPDDLIPDDVTTMTRRGALAAGAAGLATAAGVGTVAAQSSTVLDFSSDLTPAPWLTGTATIETVTPEMSDLGYINDSGETVSLSDSGGVVASREDADTPHNPTRIRADLIDSTEYTAFPRGETYDESGDGDADTDIRAVDATHWTVDNSSTAGSLSVADADGDALRVSTTGQTSGDTAVATFSDFTIGDGEARRYLQLVANVDLLEAGAIVTVRVRDAASNTVEAMIDPSGDTSNANIIAAAQGDGIAYQTQLGELTGGPNLDTIEELEIEVAEANADVVFEGINLERESRWSFGTREFVNADDDLETKTMREPVGYTGIASVDDLRETFPDADINSVEYDVEFRAEETPSDWWDLKVSTAERSDYPQRLEIAGGFEIPTAYELSISISDLYGMRTLAASRYDAWEFATGLDELPDLDDVEDISWTSRTESIRNGDLEAEQNLASTPTSDSVTGISINLQLEDDEVSSMTRAAGGGGGAAFSEGGGFLSTLVGKVTAVIMGLAGALGLNSLLGGS